MELKTKVLAEDNKQELLITRRFELPVASVFEAYTNPKLVEKWMGNKVLKMESKTHGSYRFETTDPKGQVLFRANGVIHEFLSNQKITRTFIMENTNAPVQLEFLEFKQLTPKTSQLTIHIIFKSIEDRNRLLQMPFSKGINMAHNQLQKIMNQLK